MFFRTAFTEFPSVSVCANFYDAYKSETLQKYNVSANQIRKLQFPNNDIKSLEFYKMATLNLTELLQSVQINFHDNFPNSKANKILFVGKNQNIENSNYKIENLDENNWLSENWLTLGRCYTYNIPKNLRELSVSFFYSTTLLSPLSLYCHYIKALWILG